MEVDVKEFEIQTQKGHHLFSVKYASKNNSNQIIVISSATGVLQKYYSKFAQYFAAKGFIVYTFDYHGIGESGKSLSELKKNTITLTEWGQNDQAAVVAYARNENPDAILTLITHSVGGQLIGFNSNYKLIDKVIIIASQTGYWKEFKGLHALKMFFFWYLLIPVATPLFGYLPTKKLGLFENLPKQMTYEWASWGRKKKYMMHFYNPSEYFFDKLNIPMLALCFSKDSFAPKQTVDWMTSQYKNVELNRIHHTPKKGKKHVGHFGFFKSSFEDPFWEQTHQWILNNTFQ